MSRLLDQARIRQPRPQGFAPRTALSMTRAEFSGQFWGVLQSPAFQLFSKQARPSFGTVSPLTRIAVNVDLLLTATLQPSHDWDYGNPGALLGNDPAGLRFSSAFNSASARSKCKNLEWNVSRRPARPLGLDIPSFQQPVTRTPSSAKLVGDYSILWSSSSV